MGKHAYLLMLHEETEVVHILLRLLDCENNDIYIHVDKKFQDFSAESLKKDISKATVSFTKRRKVYWGTNSITYAEIDLIREAVKKEHDYYHILSGADLPIKTQREIYQFFCENQGKEFIHFGTEQYQNDIASRYNQYHFFTKQLGRLREKKIWCDLETYSLAIQRRLKIDRTKKRKELFYGGANWCSITHEFALYIVKQFPRYKKWFYFSQNSDEMLCQTIIMNSPFKNRLYKSGFHNDYDACVRKIDWERGNPYIWQEEDLEELLNSTCMFARKFNETDKIAKMIYEKLK